MKHLFVLILIAGACFALDPDAGPVSQGIGDPVEPETDDWIIDITSVNDVSMSWGSNPRGCDYSDSYGELLVTDYALDSIFSVNPSTGAKNYGFPCPSAIPDVLGACQYQTPGENFLIINNWQSVTDIWEYSSITGWSSAFTNPAPSEPRGMDMDADLNIWEIDASSHMLYVFDLTGSVLESWSLSELPSGYSCGCSVFPFGTDQGVVIGGYAYTDFYFYSFDGSTLEYLGSAPVPQGIGSSYGISWSDDTQSFYWIYKDTGDNFRLCEFTVDFTVALQRNTWGAIKAGF